MRTADRRPPSALWNAIMALLYVFILALVIIFTAIIIAILFAGLIWDRELRMWHEQSVVMVERNPYNMHKLTPKEVVYFTEFWIPFGRAFGGEMAEKAEFWARWCDDQMAKDPVLKASVRELAGEYCRPEAGSTVHRTV